MKSLVSRLVVRALLLCVVLSAALSGCTLFPARNSTQTGALRVSIDLGVAKGGLDTLVLKSMAVTLTQGSTTRSGSASVVAGAASVSLSDLQVGAWSVAVVVTDTGDIPVYDGATTVAVTSGPSAVAVTVPMAPKAGDMSAAVAIPAGLGITKGTATLVGGAAPLPTPKEFTAGAAVAFTGLKSTSWTLKIALKDASNVVKAYGQKTVDVLPGRVNPVSLSAADYETGSANISVLIGSEPAAPTGVHAVRDASGVTVSWTKPADVSGLAGYAIYRSATEAGTPRLLNETLAPASGSSYVDATALADRAYCYWVRVYSVDGLSSDMSGVAALGAS